MEIPNSENVSTPENESTGHDQIRAGANVLADDLFYSLDQWSKIQKCLTSKKAQARFSSLFVDSKQEFKDIPQVIISKDEFEKIAFGNRSEIVATAQMPRRKLEDLTLPNGATIAVLESCEKPGNAGALMRSADAAGIDAVILVEPITDLFNPNTIRASLGTVFSLQVATAAFEEYAAWASTIGLAHYLAKCEQAAPYTDVDYRGVCAIVLGSEATGLQARWDQLKNTTSIAIPMRGSADSLNVSAAAAVLFYEALRQSGRSSSR